MGNLISTFLIKQILAVMYEQASNLSQRELSGNMSMTVYLA